MVFAAHSLSSAMYRATPACVFFSLLLQMSSSKNKWPRCVSQSRSGSGRSLSREWIIIHARRARSIPSLRTMKSNGSLLFSQLPLEHEVWKMRSGRAVIASIHWRGWCVLPMRTQRARRLHLCQCVYFSRSLCAASRLVNRWRADLWMRLIGISSLLHT